MRALEPALVASYSHFYDYARHGSRLLVLLARNGSVSQFALFLAWQLEMGAWQFPDLALASEEQLFPELFANSGLNEAQAAYLTKQLDNEYEVAFTRYTRLLLLSTEASECPCTEREVTWLEQGQSRRYPLVTLLVRLAAGNEYSPHTGHALPAITVSTLRRRYGAQLAMARHYLELKGTTS
jgi:hypothetical protein